MIDFSWLKYNKVECNYCNIDISTEEDRVITRNCLLDYYLSNNKMDSINFIYFNKIKIMIRTKCTKSIIHDMQLTFNENDTLQNVIDKYLKNILNNLLGSVSHISKDINILEKYPNFINYFIIYHASTKKNKICNYKES